MEREIDLKQISDGKYYSSKDMVKAGCNDCTGCSLCCQGMGNSVILDTYDIFCLEKGLGATFEKLMEEKLELNVVDGIICPNIKMAGSSERCSFLSGEGRCIIHAFRPGFCRMFPLGRIYMDDGFRYFLQVHECPYPNKTKVKLKKWLGIPELGKYETYIKDWHCFMKDVQGIIKETQNDVIIKNLNMYLLNHFYVEAYDIQEEEPAEGFYGQFYQRLKEAGEIIKVYR